MWIFAIIIFLVILVVVGLLGGGLYLLYLPIEKRLLKSGKLTKNRSREINISYAIVLFLFSAYQTFDAFFPSESFYKQEFKTVTLREIPKSAEFIEKTSSYPDFHGDYCSSSQIKLSKADYQKLLIELQNDKRITKNGEQIGFEEFNKTLGNKKQSKFIHEFTRKIKDEEDHYLYIAFYDDKETVFVNICVT